MRNFVLTACVFMLMTMWVQAAPIGLTVSYDGNITGDITKITDGYFPQENVWGDDNPPLPDRWNGSNNVQFNDYGEINTVEVFYFDFDGMYVLEDVKLAVDNNDTYVVEYYDGTNWSNLFNIGRYDGSASSSMDNFTTIADEDIRNDNLLDYVSTIDFTAVETNQLRLYADATRSGDIWYSIGEFQAFGTAIEGGNSAPVPEPATFLLLGSGLAGLAFYRRKRK